MTAKTLLLLVVFTNLARFFGWEFEQEAKFVESNQCETSECVAKASLEQSQCADLAKIGNLRLIKSIRRNIILVGKSGTGKSTIARMLENPEFLTSMPKLGSTTVDAELASFSVPFNNSFVNLNIIDTPGLFDMRSNPSEQQTNDVILATIKECINKEVTKISKIYFVLNHDANVNIQNFQALEIFLKAFAGGKAQLRILFSRAQMYTNAEKDEIIKQYKDFPATKELFANTKVMFAGAIDYNLKDNKEMYQKMLNSVLDMRKVLLHDIFCDSGEVPVTILHHDPVEAERRDRELRAKKEDARTLLGKPYQKWDDKDALVLQDLVHKLYPDL